VRTDPSEKRRRFEATALPFLSALYAYAVRLTRNGETARDLVQETYLRAYRFFHKFEPGTNCRAWLLSIQRHLFINRYRQRKNQPELIDWEKIDRDYDSLALGHDDLQKWNPESILCSQGMAPEIEKALKKLPEEFRSAIILVDIDELTYEEAAQILECPIGTVRSRLSRGRRMLQVALRDYTLERGLTKK